VATGGGGCDNYAMSVPTRGRDEAERVERALLAAVSIYGAGLAFACRALDEGAIELALRSQGRVSFLLFVLSLTAPWLQRRGGWSWAAWLERNRDALLRAFALSHLIHGAWIVIYFVRTPATFSWDLVDISGALAFPLIALLLLPIARGPSARSARVRSAVSVYAWLQFIGFFIDRLLHGRRELMAWYCVAIVVCLAVARIATLARSREPLVS
jgi:hypothetical protein